MGKCDKFFCVECICSCPLSHEDDNQEHCIDLPSGCYDCHYNVGCSGCDFQGECPLEVFEVGDKID